MGLCKDQNEKHAPTSHEGFGEVIENKAACNYRWPISVE